MDNLVWGLQMTVLGMGLVFGLLALLWGLLTLVLRFDKPPAAVRRRHAAGRRARAAALPPPACRPACRAWTRNWWRRSWWPCSRTGPAPARGRAGHAQLLARQPALRLALGGRRAATAEPQLAAEGQMMRRYTLGLRGREFVIDVQELAADRFEVVVGDETYEVTLSGDEDLPARDDHAGLPAAAWHRRVARRQRRPPRPRRATRRAAPRGCTGARRPAARPRRRRDLSAPMPGVILEVHVKAGDVVERGQQIAVLEAMKMHNLIGAPRAGTIGEVCVAAGPGRRPRRRDRALRRGLKRCSAPTPSACCCRA